MGRTAPKPWEWIAQARTKAGISKSRMARLLDIQDRAYRRWEQAPGVRPEVIHLERFCTVTGSDLKRGIEIVYGVTIPGYLNRPIDVLAGVA
jgi:transcriptional regulator with XRE-family HTH domain